MQASDVMTVNPYTTEPNASLYDVVWTMFDTGIRHVPVLLEGELVGILSDRDLRQFSLSMLDFPEEARAKLAKSVVECMSSDVVTVSPETPLPELIDLLLENRIGALPVLDAAAGDLLGIVSYVDILRGLQGLSVESMPPAGLSGTTTREANRQ